MGRIYAPCKNIWQFIVIHIVIGIICAFVFLPDPFESVGTFLMGFIWGMIIFSSQWLGHAYIQGIIGIRYSWRHDPLIRLLLTIISIVAYSIIGFILVQSLMEYLFLGKVSKNLWQFDLELWKMPILISFFFSIVISSVGFFLSWKRALIQQEKLTAQMLTYKYESLRNQINPHFMFNSLNVLSDLVYEDQKLAVKFIHQFSDIYRYVLDSREKELIELSAEIELIKKFIFLLKTRFDEKLQIKMNVEFDKNDFIVPLALQLLIENAVKHNEVSTQNPLEISIIRENNRITVSNPIRLKNIGENSKKVGLENLKSQFSYFSDQELIINATDQNYTVSIPIIKKA